MPLRYRPRDGDHGVILTRKGTCALQGFEVGDTVRFVCLYTAQDNFNFYNVRNLKFRNSGSTSGYGTDEQIQWHIDVHDLVELRR